MRDAVTMYCSYIQLVFHIQYFRWGDAMVLLFLFQSVGFAINQDPNMEDSKMKCSWEVGTRRS
jgi:hypothetical protein